MRFDVLSRDLNVLGPHFLEASAGTGKTFAIEHFVTRLLIEKNPPLSIHEVLIVTFTRAATRELKIRIRRNLQTTYAQLVSDDPSVDYLKALVEEGKQEETLRRIKSVLAQFDSAQIFTLHGFCFRALKEFALEANMGFGLSNPEEIFASSFLEKYTKNFLKEELKSLKFSPYQIHLLLKRYQFDIKKLSWDLINKATGNHSIAPFKSFDELHEELLCSLKAFPEIEAKKWVEDVFLLTPHYKKMTDPSFPSQIQLLAKILEKRSCERSEFQELLKKEFFLERIHPDYLKVRAQLPSSEALHYPGLVEQVKEMFLPAIQVARDPIKIFFRVAKALKEKLADVFETQEYFSPDGILQKMAEAVEIPSFVEKLQKRYRSVIVDEFQDTDPLQWKIIEKLFCQTSDAICLVGDPKQSIYAFRNADVYTYLHAAEKLGETAKKRLDTNYRSTPSLVQALNTFFALPGPNWLSLPLLGQGLDVMPVHFVPKEETFRSPPLHFFMVEDSQERGRQIPTDDTLERKILPFIGSTLAKLYQEEGVRFEEMAILVKDRFQAKKVIEHLKKWNIPAYFKRGSFLFHSPAFYALKEVLEATLFPYDLNRLKIALGSCFIGWDVSLLKRGIEDEEVLEAKRQMLILHQLLVNRGFALFFQQFLNSSFSSSQKTVLTTLLFSNDPTLYKDLRKLSEILIEEEVHRGLKREQLLDFLERMGEEAQEEESRFKAPCQQAEGSVVIMTTHLSKGLEFDTVFALGTVARNRLPQECVIRKEEVVPFDANHPLCIEAIKELEAEKLRQLYVALTRAKKRLYVPIVIDKEGTPPTFGTASAIELFFQKCLPTISIQSIQTLFSPFTSLISCDVIQEQVPSPLPSLQLEAFPPRFMTQIDLPKPQLITSFSALYQKREEVIFSADLSMENPSDLSPLTLPLGVETGQILHRIFEKLFKLQLYSPFQEEKISLMITQEIQGTLLERFHSIFLPWLKELLSQEICGMRLLALVPSHVQQEMEFYFPSKDYIVKGFCDLLFQWEGKYYLLDWKSNYLGSKLEDYSKENIEKTMDAHGYFLQASIYKEALKRYVKLFDKRPFEEVFGGAIYFFIRGNAPYVFIPSDWSFDS